MQLLLERVPVVNGTQVDERLALRVLHFCRLYDLPGMCILLLDRMALVLTGMPTWYKGVMDLV